MEQRRLLGVVALAAVGLYTLSGCGLLPRSSFEDEEVLTEEVTAVRVDTSNGGVTVRGADGTTDVTLHRRVEHGGDEPGATHQVEDDGTLVLGGCGWNCAVHYTVDLPAGLPVSGGTSNGEIDLSGVGEVDVETDNGAITLDGITGPASVRTSNGTVEGRGLDGGPIEARSDNGEIDLTLATPQDVRAETSNGEITLTVPDGAYQVSTDTDNGSTDIGIADDPAGEHRLDLTTDNGSITVSAS